MQQGREGWGSCPDAQGLQTIFLLLPSHERIFLVESCHAAGRGGVGKLSRRPGTPKFVPASSFFRENSPGWVWSRNRKGRRGEVVPTLRDSKIFVPCFFFFTRDDPWLNLVTQQGGEGWGSCPDAQGLQFLFPASFFSRENIPG